ncbi:patatin-like phospholipase family protein [Ideonella sp. BN130291]|uniref:patatin-like phospholipase family protein n=1 Tax=Ideonella sp. BN130291 TaxID=3112940 RepID=UPI002E275EA5|nr:patatin-like phospholipase family protein [Ideonella sp. BN130291]
MSLLSARPSRRAGVPLSLALQGGGAHGAFTWGVLDALLAQGTHPIHAISGTSAGAVNAVALAQGWMDNGAEGARQALDRLWTAIGSHLPFEWLTVGSGESLALAPGARALLHWTRYLSPQQLNPLDVNPLRDLLRVQIDFERLRRHSPVQLFIAATHANSGQLRLFRTRELSLDAVLASACLPTLYKAVVIDGEPYWDGGYAANPALFPLIVDGGPADLLMVLLSPLQHAHEPRTAQQIHERALDIAFNATFLREARLLGEAHAVARRSWLPLGRLERRVRRMRFHLVHAPELLGALRSETRLIAHLPFLQRLRDQGREHAAAWLAGDGHALGRRSSVDLVRLFGSPRPARQGMPA